MTPSARLRPFAVLLTVATLLLTGCGGGSEDGGDEPTVPDGMVLVDTELGTVARPEQWQPVENAETADRVAGFEITEDGELVGQMDVFVNALSPGVEADTVDAAVQAQRFQHFKGLEHTRRDFVEVPGAASGFLTESTYLHAETGEEIRSIDQVAVTEEGEYLLVRISAGVDAYDEELFAQVVDTMALSDEGS